MRQCCKEFAQIYYEDVNEVVLEVKSLHLKEYLEHIYSENEETDSIRNISYFEKKKTKLKTYSFSNVEIALRILMVTSCSGERSVSKLKRIKNELRSAMQQKRLNSLSLLSIECDMLKAYTSKK